MQIFDLDNKKLFKFILYFNLYLFILFFFQAALAGNTHLNKQERLWLKQHPIIKIAPDPNFEPFEFFSKNNIYKGIGADYIHLVQQKLGIQFKVIKLKDWATILESIKHKKIDLLPITTKSKNREEFLNFSKPFYSASTVVVSSSQKFINLKDLNGHEIAIVDGYVFIDLFKKNYPKINPVIVKDISTGLELVSLGAIESMVGSLPTISHEVKKLGINNLHLVKDLDLPLDYRIAVRKDWSILVSILNKTLDAISKQEHKKIKSKWAELKDENFWMSALFWYSFLFVISGLILSIILISVWNRLLSKQVKIRSEQLQQARTQLIHAEKMETIGRLAAGIAHEVKNPLAIILMGIEYFSSSVKDTTEKEVLDDMDNAVQRADRVIKGLLDFSREKKLTKIDKNINNLLEESIHLVDYEMRQRNIKIHHNFSTNLPLIKIDTNRIQQVLINLLMNSAHAIEKEGNIFISSSLVLENKQLIVQINDDGCGLPEKDNNKVFEPFYTTKPQGFGTGLGLSVSQNIMALHDGKIEIKNRDTGGGASVVLYFPLTDLE